MNISVHCCWSWDHLRIKERPGVYKETVSISGLANIARKSGEFFSCESLHPVLAKWWKDALPNKLGPFFPVLSSSLEGRWPLRATLCLGHLSRWFLIYLLTTVLFKVVFVDARVNIKGEYIPKDRNLLNFLRNMLGTFFSSDFSQFWSVQSPLV